ncbi:aminoglycoside phosphotransferase family protein [Rivibacter subsaxonicus]|nr:phosphotransferase [Rivibacter subsaxonicus]
MSQTPIHWADPARATACAGWLGACAPQLQLAPDTLRAASADASFRRYLRVDGGGGRSFIVMDAPPAQENCGPFVQVAELLHQAGLHTPRVLAWDEAQGFMLLDDLGQQLFLAALRDAPAAEADALMRDAISALVQMQLRADASALPAYDDALLRREVELFPTWCVEREFGIRWNADQQALWTSVSQQLIDSALAQPTVFVHRDWMPRNLMVSTPNPGVLDFQDAVRGPIAYDMASLLRDAFISWEEERELDWAVRYWQQARTAGLRVDEDFGEFWRQLEWMGLQRHLKVLGIFCRLKHRDGKPSYSADLPRFFAYATKVALRYRPLAPLLRLIEPMSGPMTQTGFSLR